MPKSEISEPKDIWIVIVTEVGSTTLQWTSQFPAHSENLFPHQLIILVF